MNSFRAAKIHDNTGTLGALIGHAPRGARKSATALTLLNWLVVVLALLMVTPPARAADGAAIRLGAHATYGRVVFVVPPHVTAQMSLQDDNIVKLSLPGAGAVPGAVHGTRNVVSVSGGDDSAVLVLAPGSRPVLWQGAGKVVVDIYGANAPTRGIRNGEAAAAKAPLAAPPASVSPPALVSPPAATSGHNRAADRPAASEPGQVHAPGGPPAPAHATALPHAISGTIVAAATPEVDVVRSVAPATVVVAKLAPPPDPGTATEASIPLDQPESDALVATRTTADAAGGREAILMPFDRGVGAAAFFRAGLAHVVFDDSKPVDMAQLKDDPVFGSARVTLLPAATHFTLSLAPGKRLSLRRLPEGWLVMVVPQSEPVAAAAVRMQGGAVSIATPQAAELVVMDDPATGDHLLVGTVASEGAGVTVPHLSPEFSLLPSWTGAAVVARSDRLTLRAEKAGFSLAVATGPAMAAVVGGATEQALSDAGTLTRHFALMPVPMATGRSMLISDMGAIARAPKLARFVPRLRAAQDMLALGLDRETGAMLRRAMQDDPDQAQNADAQGLLAMADWVAGRGDGSVLAAPALGASDEMAFWRAVVQPVADGKAAATVADTWRLALAYPPPLRTRLLAVAADIMLRGGQHAAAEALLAHVPDASLDPQRAEALRLDGKTDAALALLDQIGERRDRKQAAAALRGAVELRLAAGKITPSQAAAALDKRLYAWRDPALEVDQRLRIATLRSQAGQWRDALSILRETDALFPDMHEKVRAQERNVIADLLASSTTSHLAPLDLVALVAENADLLAEKGASETLAPVLADKLLALDLPDRADPVLGKLMAATAAPEAKAGLGARLAALRLDQGDAAGAKAALTDSDAAGLPAALAAHRTVLQARALMLDHADDAALALLAGQDSPEALELQARLLEKRQDWHGADAVLQALARVSLPAKGTLTDAEQDLVLRLASAGSEAGDMALLQQLQNGNATRLSAGPRSELFQALATRPVQALSDLPRSGREAVADRAVPAALASYDTH